MKKRTVSSYVIAVKKAITHLCVHGRHEKKTGLLKTPSVPESDSGVGGGRAQYVRRRRNLKGHVIYIVGVAPQLTNVLPGHRRVQFHRIC